MISQKGAGTPSASSRAAGLPDLLLLSLFLRVWASLPGSALWQPCCHQHGGSPARSCPGACEHKGREGQSWLGLS